MDNFEAHICHALEQGKSIVQATVLRHAGSTPRVSGTRMLIHMDGSIYGTIGGGLVEATVMRSATGLFKQDGHVIKTFDLTSSKTRNSLDMICGGRMVVFMESITPTEENRRYYDDLKNAFDTGKKYLAITALPLEENQTQGLRRCLVDEKGNVGDACRIRQSELDSILSKTGFPRTLSEYELNGMRYIINPLYVFGRIFIFGAGHVGMEIARIGSIVDFRTLVFDDRGEFANRERFESADGVYVLQDFNDVFHGFEVDEDSYVVIVTRGHSHDKTVLSQALSTQAGYIGMIGSRAKRDTIYRQLMHEGFSENDLKRVFSPIGVKIDAQTPAEIAVSIMAELIRERASKNEHPWK